jgi:DNA-binding transcriptional ArsR family regulator
MATATRTKPAPASKPAAPDDATYRRVATLFRMVSDPNRLRIIRSLEGQERHVAAICEAVGQPQPAVSHHLNLLKLAGLIEPRRAGKNNFYRLLPTGENLARTMDDIAGA